MKSILGYIGIISLMVSGNAYSWIKLKCGTADRVQPTLSRPLCASSVSFPTGSSFRNSYDTVMSRWNGVQNMQFSLADGCYVGNTSDSVSATWFTSTMPTGFENNTAVAYQRWNTTTCQFTASDVIFNNNKTWTSAESMAHAPFRTYTSTLPFYSVATHELGHVLGLDHENRKWNIMGIDQSFVTFRSGYSDYRGGADALSGVYISYGSPSSWTDMSVSIFRFDPVETGTSEYSHHKEGEVRHSPALTPAPSSTNTVTPGPERRYNLVRGNTYRFELTFENVGNIAGNMPIDGYLSSDISFDGTDTYLGNWSYTNFARNSWPTEAGVNITIPLSAPTGNGFVGFNIGCTYTSGTCSDTNHWNNSTYYAVNIL